MSTNPLWATFSDTAESTRVNVRGRKWVLLVQEGTGGHFQRVISPRVRTEQVMAQRNGAASLHGYHQIKVEEGWWCRRLGSPCVPLSPPSTSIGLGLLIPHLPISGWPRSNVSKHKTPVHTYLNDCPFAGYPGKPRYQARNRSRAVPGEVMMNQASKGLLVEFNQEFRVGISPSDLTTISDRLPGIRRL